MKNINEQNNIARVIGRISTQPKKSHEIEDEKFYELTLRVKRLSEAYDYIPITVSERLLDNRTLCEGDVIAVEGEFRSYNKLEEEKSKLILHVFARDLWTEKEFDKFEDLSDTNKVCITGYVCKEPIFRTTPFKREICDALIAVNRRNFKSDYLPCIFWGRNARYMEKQEIGTKISIEGRIQSRAYIKKLPNGQEEERIAYEISVSKLKQLEMEDVYPKNEEYKDYLQENYLAESEKVRNL